MDYFHRSTIYFPLGLFTAQTIRKYMYDRKKKKLNHCAVHLKLTQYCKSSILQWKKKLMGT